MDHLAAMLDKAGLHVEMRRRSICVEDRLEFLFDAGEPQIDYDRTAPLEETTRLGNAVSDVLSAARFRHRLEVYDDEDRLAAYYHYEWPLPESVNPPASNPDGPAEST